MKQLSIFRLSAIILATFFMFSACSKSGGGAYGGNNNTGGNNNNNNTDPNTVKMSGMTFSPASLSITAGTTVTFFNDDNTTHTVTEDGGVFDSGNVAPGASYKHTFATGGTVKYHCKIHSGMKGSVVVSP